MKYVKLLMVWIGIIVIALLWLLHGAAHAHDDHNAGHHDETLMVQNDANSGHDDGHSGHDH
jgi:hypothetical protein